jgi:PAS domain S-box-containing protein
MTSLRFRLIVIVLVAITPLAGLIIYANVEQRRAATERMESDLQRLIENCDSDYRHMLEHSRQLLTALAAFPAVKGHDAKAGAALFSRIVKQSHLYHNIMATTQDGTIFASVQPLPPGRNNLAGRLYFKRILERQEFSLGEMVLGHTLGVPTLPCAAPILDDEGGFRGVVAAGLNLGQLRNIFQIKDLTASSCFMIIDNRGRIMLRLPEPERLVEEDPALAEIIPLALERRKGFAEARGVDGRVSFFAFMPLGGATQEGFVIYGIPAETILAPLRQALIRNLASLGAVTILALILAWGLGYVFIVKRMNILTRTTRELAAGDLHARTGLDYGKGEIDSLARAFDEMAATLQKRETERGQAEENLRKSEEQYRLLVNQIPAVVYKGYPDWTLECLDDKIEEVTGYSQNDFNSRRVTWQDLMFPEDAAQAKRLFNEARKTNRFYVTEHRIRRRDGKVIWIQARNRLFLDVAGKTRYLSGVFFDITERKTLEDQLIQAQKMEAVGILAGGMAHDFNNLLTAIMGYSDIMLMDLKEEDPLRHSAREIMKAADRGASLTNKLLAFSRKQILQPRVINLNAIVADIEKMLKPLIGEDIELVTHIPGDLGLVKADPGQVEQILMNLAVNARDAMPQGGKLVIETEDVYLDEEYAGSHAGVSPGQHVMLAVTDSGVGMDAETMAHIFEPFFTTKESGKGTGLGLAMVYGIVKQSGGHIWVYSEPGQGTCFKIYFPIVEEGETVAAQPVLSPAQSLYGNETVLLVEDDAVLRRLVTGALRKYGYQAREAGSGEEALALGKTEKGRIDLLLTDVVMPGMNGRELAERLAVMQPGVKVLYMSGYTTNAIVHHGILDEEINFIQKPIKLRNLMQKVREILEARKPSSGDDIQSPAKR